MIEWPEYNNGQEPCSSLSDQENLHKGEGTDLWTFGKIENSEVAKFEFMKSATKYVEEIYVRMMEINAKIGRNS